MAAIKPDYKWDAIMQDQWGLQHDLGILMKIQGLGNIATLFQSDSKINIIPTLLLTSNFELRRTPTMFHGLVYNS